MGRRFRKSIKIAPGIRMNFGKKSTSISIGGHGFHKTISPTGRVTNSFGLPGTGLYYTETSSSRRQSTSSERQASSYRDPLPSAPVVPAAPVIDVSAIKNSIRDIYRVADETVDWEDALTNPSADAYLRERANRILDGDIDTYFQVISDVNPLDDLIQYGSEFECGTEDPRRISIHFNVNSAAILRQARFLPKEQYNDLWQDYVCGCSIRIARDMFALLPLRHVIVDAHDGNREILSVDFKRRSFEGLDFDNIDASDTVEKFEHHMEFNIHDGFQSIIPLDTGDE